MHRLKPLTICLFFILITLAPAQDASVNYDESKVPAYSLADPLMMLSGKKVHSAAEWWHERRPEILKLFETNVYGKTPQRQIKTKTEILSRDTVFNSRAIRKQVKITFGSRPDDPYMILLIYLPESRPAPVFIGANFSGNHSVTDDPAVLLSRQWVANDKNLGITDHKATESSRGSAVSSWPIEKIIDGGYGVVTFYYGDLDPDFDDGFQNGVQPLFYKKGQTRPAADEWGAVGAWAWGLSRAMDYCETDKDIDAKKAIVIGHSRLGKAAVWAGAQDQRFAGVVSNNSGCGGAALSKRIFGETVGIINRKFPHWFCGNFKQYNDNEDKLPVDQHMLISLIAPRPVYIASAEEDRWADPRGEFLSAVHASPAYRLLGVEGFSATEMPAVNQPVMGRIAYHIRSGKHDVTLYDWQRYMEWADKYIKIKD